MIRPRPAFLGLLLLVGTLAVVIGMTYQLLPDRVASHFSVSGKPDGWMSRPTYAAVTFGGAILVATLCAAPLYLSRYLPDTMINIPNRAYWLSPDRREETYARLQAFGLWLSCLCVAMFIGLHVLTLKANRSVPVRLPMADGLALMAAFLLGMGALCYGLCRKYWQTSKNGDIPRS